MFVLLLKYQQGFLQPRNQNKHIAWISLSVSVRPTELLREYNGDKHASHFRYAPDENCFKNMMTGSAGVHILHTHLQI